MANASKKILIVGPSWVGDMVMAQSLFIVLKEQQSDCVIDVLAPAWSMPILERMSQIRKGISMPVGHGSLELGKRFSLARTLAKEQYDQAVVLPNSLKSALIPMLAGIPVRTGWRGEMRFGLINDIRLLNKKKYPLMVQRFVALAYPAGAPIPETCPKPALEIDEEKIPELYEKYQINSEKPLLALCPGAEFGPSKRWPEQHYAAVAKYYIDKGWQVALFGSNNDRIVNANIKEQLTSSQRCNCVNLAGKTALSEAVDILSQSAGVVSNDSGLMHICAAMNKPMVVVYGSTSPLFTPPLSNNVAVAQLPVDCGPCFKRECPLSESDGRMDCLNKLAPESIVSELNLLLAS